MMLTTSHWICMLVVDARPSVGVSSPMAITWQRPAGTGLKCGVCRSGELPVDLLDQMVEELLDLP
eukprot:9404701-Prorocentrum_lima.AAC.1